MKSLSNRSRGSEGQPDWIITKMHRFIVGSASFLIWWLALGCAKQPATSLVDDGGGRQPKDFPELAEDVFKAMDGGIQLTGDEIKGRNTWNLWCGGNEQFWDRVAREELGLFDLLKTIDSRNRNLRFKELGLINEPGYRQAAKPDRYGIWLDEPIEPPQDAIDPKVYGRSTGVMGRSEEHTSELQSHSDLV